MRAPNSELCRKAWFFAARKHQGQTYPGGDLPYLTHIGAVLLALLPALHAPADAPAAEADADLAICCALLHDTIEDTETGLPELEEQFGNGVAEGVLALSKDKKLSGRAAMLDSLERIMQQPREVWLVKLADRIANLGSPPASWSREKRLAYAEEAELILACLGTASAQLAETLAGRIKAWKTAACSDKK